MFILVLSLESNKWSVNGLCLNSHAEMYVLGELRENISMWTETSETKQALDELVM